LGDLLTQKAGGTPTFIIVVIYREVGDAAVGIVGPVLGAFGGKDRVLAGKEKDAARPQHPVDILYHAGIILHIVQRQRAEHDVEGAVGKVDVLDGAATVFHVGSAGLLPRHRQHLVRQVDAGHLP